MWDRSAGLGTVYSTTTIFEKDSAPRNVVLVDLDEGVRLMSRVAGVTPEEVRIGMRVSLRPEVGATIPVFEPAE